MPPSAPPMPPAVTIAPHAAAPPSSSSATSGPEHPLGAPGHVPDPEAHEARPEPAPRADGAPALGELREERASLRRKRSSRPEACRESPRSPQTSPRRSRRPSPPRRRHDHAGQRRPGDPASRSASAPAAHSRSGDVRGLTACGTRPVEAGAKNDCAAPTTAASTTNCHSATRPEITSTARISSATQRTMSHESITSGARAGPTTRRRRG